jgi:hypothetical protein
MTDRPFKVMFVGRSTSHFSYYETIIAALHARGAVVDLVLDKHWSKENLGGASGAISEFQALNPWFSFRWLQRRSDRLRNTIFKLRELRSYRSYLVRPETTPFYIHRWRKYLAPGFQKLLDRRGASFLLRSPPAGWLLKAVEALTPPDPGILDFIRGAAPDVLILSPMNMRYSEDVDYAKAARALGVPTAVSTLSWDNLSTKGVFAVRPDRLFVWNKYQLGDALEIQQMPSDRVVVAGSPFFDKWFDKTGGLQTRAAFCRRVGLDPKKKILLYLGSSKNIAKDEAWVVAKILKHMRASEDPTLRDCQILVRPHPANADVYANTKARGLAVYPKDGALPETIEQFSDMRNSFHHADVAVNINTSGMIDAVLSDLPTFAVRIGKYDYTQSGSKHFQYLERGEAIYIRGEKDIAEGIGEVLNGADPKAEERRAFAQMFARPQGLERSAGDVIAESALKMAAEKRRLQTRG